MKRLKHDWHLITPVERMVIRLTVAALFLLTVCLAFAIYFEHTK